MAGKRIDETNLDMPAAGHVPGKAVHADANRDPLTDEPGAHPIGAGVGAAAAGAAIGAAGGAVGGPIGAAVGAVVGGLAGGLAGKHIAESIDPTVEDAYWHDTYATRPYHEPGSSYEDYRPAYQYGWESRGEHADRKWDEVEHDLGRRWDSVKAHSRLTWDRAKHAARDAWDRVDQSVGDQGHTTTRGETATRSGPAVGTRHVEPTSEKMPRIPR